jgi:hypothetical protein
MSESRSVTPIGSDLERELRRVVEGEVRFDDYSRLLYSTDASMYQVEPIGVVLPRSTDDVRAVLELANRYNVPVLPRGGGTSLIGQTVNEAVVLDFSKYMNQVLEVNREELWCRVQPGVIQDELNAQVRPLGLLFGPDTSTSNRASSSRASWLTARRPCCGISRPRSSRRSAGRTGSRGRSTARCGAWSTSTRTRSAPGTRSSCAACRATTSTSS